MGPGALIDVEVPLGPFAAVAPLARGGMGAVYRGVHREQGVPVAIKVIPGAHRASPAAQKALREEVRAMARLDHRAIVRVLDHGEVDGAASAASGGTLEVGDGYIVMELAGAGSLSRTNLPGDFASCAELLDTLLDGLAHAHAHGVIHRDLKPANVLLAGRHDLRPGPKLTDFGIAYATMEVYDELDPSSAAGRVVGTPLFMAPEQVRGRWRDFGPWTDLYAFGCLAWAVLTGSAPFPRKTLFAVAHAQMNDRPPPLAPRVAVPDGVEDWLRTLLRKDCALRYQAAAHARRDLAALRGAATSPAWTPEPGTLRGIDVGAELQTVVARRAITGRQTQLASPITQTTSGFSAEDPPIAVRLGVAAEGLAHPGAPNRRDELPPWEGDPPRPEGLALVGAGLALHGLRPVPLVGRVTERERLWALLDAARATRSPKLGLLVGPAGTGKSRLADWLAVRAHQLGAAVVLRARHSAGGGPGEGLVGMVARHLRCHGMAREELASRLTGLLPGALPDIVDAREVLQLLLDPRASVTLSADDRHAAVRFVLSRLGQRGPVVVVLEDAQWGVDALRFADGTLRAGLAAGPVLFVTTVRDDQLAFLDEPRDVLDGLPAGAVERIPVPPLDEDATRALVAGMLRFRGSLADELATRSAGSPQFAVQLVGDWVERDLLEPGPDGFRMRPGVDPSLPADLEAAWAERVARLTDGMPDGALTAIERAAVLGHEVDRGEWVAVCADTAVEPVEEHLLAQRLALPAENGWTFAHAMVREAVLQALPPDRARAHHLAAAAMLQGREAPARAERLGRHLLAAGEHAEAASHLLAAAEERLLRSELPTALRLLDARRRALGDDAPGPDRLAGVAVRTRVLLAQGALDASIATGEELLALATGLGDDAARCDALLSQAESRTQKGEVGVARAQATEGFALATMLEDADRIGRASTLLAHLADREGDWKTAERWLTRSVAEAERGDDPVRLGGALRILGRARHALGDVDGAVQLTVRALEAYRAPGGRLGRAHCLTALGEYARSEGDHGAAEEHYRAAIRAYESLGSGLRLFPRFNLGMLLVLEGRFDEAWLTLEATAQEARATGLRFMIAACEAGLLAVAAGRGDWASFDRHLAGARREFGEVAVTEPDFVALVRRAAALCRDAGDGRRAASATRLAAWMGGLPGA